MFASFQISVNRIVGLGLVGFRSGAVACGADRLASILALGEGVCTYTSCISVPSVFSQGIKYTSLPFRIRERETHTQRQADRCFIHIKAMALHEEGVHIQFDTEPLKNGLFCIV